MASDSLPGKSPGLIDWRNLLQEKTRPTTVLKLESGTGAPVLASSDGSNLDRGEFPDFTDHYLHLRLINFYHPIVRRGWLEQQPVVYSRANWRQPSNGDLPRAKIITPSTLDHKKAKTGGNFAFNGQSMFGPTLFNGALDFSIGMLVRRSNSKARKLIEGAAKTIGAVNGAGLLELDFDPRADVIHHLIGWMLPDGNSDFLLGASWDVPGAVERLETGTWALLPGGESSEGIWLDPGENRLMREDGEAVNAPYLVYSLEATKQNPDRARLPEVSAAWDRVRAGLTRGTDLSQDSVGDLFKLYCMTVQLSEQLSSFDKMGLLETARRHFDRYKEMDQWFETDDKADLASLDKAPDFDAPAIELQVESEFNALESQRLERAGPALNGDARMLADNKIAELVTRLVALAVKDPLIARDNIVDAAANLRKSRLWEPLKQLASELRDKGVTYPRLSYFGAAAHAELGDLEAAESSAARALILAEQDNADSAFHKSEALGLLGRIWKTRAVNSIDKSSAETKQALRRAMAFYKRGDEAISGSERPNDPFHKVNLLALTTFARAHGHHLGDQRTMSRWAKKIVRQSAKESGNPWAAANAGEALLYLGKPDAAAKQFEAYLESQLDNPFALNGTRRNLVDLWAVNPEEKTPLSEVVRDMGIASIVSGADVVLTVEELRAYAAMPISEIEALETVFGKRAAVDATHLRNLLAKGTFVGRVCRQNGKPVGTGFLIPGETLHPTFSGETLFVTNDHVIRDEPAARVASVTRSQAAIFFEQADPGTVYQVKEIVWRSDYLTGSDCAICRLYSVPDIPSDIEPLEPRRRLMERWRTSETPFALSELSDAPQADQAPKVYILGHPDGRALSVSMHDNFMIDHEHPNVGEPAPAKPVRIHYTAPTEPGSSGSPVLSADTLELIALHHSGPVYEGEPLMGQPGPESGEYAANQGHWFQAIIAEMKADLSPEPIERAGERGEHLAAERVLTSGFVDRPADGTIEQIEGSTITLDEVEENEQFFAALEADYAEGERDADVSALEGMSTSDWQALANKPVAHWDVSDAHPDIHHLSDVQTGANQEFLATASALRKALAFASAGPVDRYNKKVLFGIRGALPCHEVSPTGIPEYRTEAMLVASTPDHSTFSCTMGVWDTETDELWLTPASTVPAVGYMWRHAHKEPGESNVANMLPPGIYRYRIGCHRRTASTRQAGAFIQDSKLCVMRSPSLDLTFGVNDVWDCDSDKSAINIYDNIHGGMGGKPAWAAHFYSAGCQVIDGSVVQRESSPQPTRLWSKFRQAAGLQAKPLMKPGSLIDTTEDGQKYTYVLLTAKEVRIASENIDVPDNDPRFSKLRRGSQGDSVVALQNALGIAADGDFGFLTQRALIIRQQELAHSRGIVVDGVLTARNAQLLGVAEFGVRSAERVGV